MSLYAKRLDKTRDYGSNHPPEAGVFYWQDGVPFDHEGYVVDAVAERALEHLSAEDFKKKLPLAKKPAVAPALAAKPVVAAKPPRPQAVAGDGGEGGDEGGQGEGGDPNVLNLEMWLRGEDDPPYKFADVQKAVKERYSAFKTSRRDLILFLVEEQKIVAPEALSVDNLKLIGGE